MERGEHHEHGGVAEQLPEQADVTDAAGEASEAADVGGEGSEGSAEAEAADEAGSASTACCSLADAVADEAAFADAALVQLANMRRLLQKEIVRSAVTATFTNVAAFLLGMWVQWRRRR
ncbi:unnamed protein product [Effrenium voratum]|uniref:Uncharacterized protein n=1 Tax=Effrenium voratum TaxID=2562239 RepID=A0AA36IKV0_9DINO|nr:unnamed protein product [Effrenium voratum]CAJ1398471.1 unnamed protein product [Effrenium voratum]